MNHGSKNFQPSGILQRTILQNVRLITAQANEMEWSSTPSLLTKKYFLLLYKNKKKKREISPGKTYHLKTRGSKITLQPTRRFLMCIRHGNFEVNTVYLVYDGRRVPSWNLLKFPRSSKYHNWFDIHIWLPLFMLSITLTKNTLFSSG